MGLEPTMLSYSDCILCYTCGEYYDYKVLALNSGTYYEYGSSCADPYHRVQNDDAYVCCKYLRVGESILIQRCICAQRREIVLTVVYDARGSARKSWRAQPRGI